MDGIELRLLNTLVELGYAPEKEIREDSPLEDYFNVIITEEGLPGRFGIIAIGGKAVAIDLGWTKEQALHRINTMRLALLPETNPV